MVNTILWLLNWAADIVIVFVCCYVGVALVLDFKDYFFHKAKKDGDEP